MRNITKKIKETFVDAGITVVPVIGNHDSFPADHFENFKPRDNKNIEEWGKTWSAFIDEEAEMKRFLDYGYYSLPFKAATNGTQFGKTRVISLNSNVCY